MNATAGHGPGDGGTCTWIEYAVPVSGEESVKAGLAMGRIAAITPDFRQGTTEAAPAAQFRLGARRSGRNDFAT